MKLQEKIKEDWKLALKNRAVKKDALSMILNELKNRAIKENLSEGGRVVEDSIAVEVLQKMAKQRREAIDAYLSAGRLDLSDKEKNELLVIEEYLPKQMTDDELNDVIHKVIAECGAGSKKDMGRVITGVLQVVKGRADGKRVQQMVQSILADRG